MVKIDYKEMGLRIETLRKKNKMSMQELGSIVGVSASTIMRYERGSFSKIKIPVVESLARALGVSGQYLATGVEEQPAINTAPAPTFVRKPRIGAIACGAPILAEEHIEDYDDVPEGIPCDFTLTCKGDSMINARIYDGDIVCIRKQDTISSGDIAAVLVGGEEATLKRVRLYSDHIILEAENPQYKPLVFWEEDMNSVRIIGKATYLIGKIN